MKHKNNSCQSHVSGEEMRLFIAATLAKEQLSCLEEAQSILQQNSRKISLTKKNNLHLTLHFLGETKPADTERLLKALQNFQTLSAEQLFSRLADYGYFRRRDGNLVYADLEVSAQMIELRQELAELLQKLNFRVDKRSWKPHVTLSRRTIFSIDWQALQNSLSTQEATYPFADINLFKSEFTSQGMRYTPIYKF